MVNFILSLPWYCAAGIIIFLISLVAIVGLVCLQSKLNVKLFKEHHEVSGYVFNLIGVVYAVLLGFTISNVQQRVDSLHKTVEAEAQIVLDLYRNAEIFPTANKEEIRKALDTYAREVVDGEWQLMHDGKCSPVAKYLFHQIWQAYYNMSPRSEKENIWYAQSISQLNEFNSMRLVRVYSCQASLGPLMWVLLIAGGFMTIASVYFFCITSFRLQVILTLFVTAIISFMIFIILTLNHPFSGEMGIKPDAMKAAINMFTSWR
jgi:hypothetical protein